jgi:hypothetical protein
MICARCDRELVTSEGKVARETGALPVLDVVYDLLSVRCPQCGSLNVQRYHLNDKGRAPQTLHSDFWELLDATTWLLHHGDATVTVVEDHTMSMTGKRKSRKRTALRLSRAIAGAGLALGFTALGALAARGFPTLAPRLSGLIVMAASLMLTLTGVVVLLRLFPAQMFRRALYIALGLFLVAGFSFVASGETQWPWSGFFIGLSIASIIALTAVSTRPWLGGRVRWSSLPVSAGPNIGIGEAGQLWVTIPGWWRDVHLDGVQALLALDSLLDSNQRSARALELPSSATGGANLSVAVGTLGQLHSKRGLDVGRLNSTERAQLKALLTHVLPLELTADVRRQVSEARALAAILDDLG